MDIQRIRQDKYNIFIESLREGTIIQYNDDWKIFIKDNVLYQTSYSEFLNKEVTHNSSITVNELFRFVDNLNDQQLKTIWGNISLLKLQRKLSITEFNPLDHEQTK